MTEYLKIPWEVSPWPVGVEWAAEMRLDPERTKPAIRVSTHSAPGLDAYELVKHLVALHNAALEEKP